MENQLKEKELITLKEVEINELIDNLGGNYRVETKSKYISATISYPTSTSQFKENITMGLCLNGEPGIIVTYNFNEEKDVKYIIELIKPSKFSENYWYNDGTKQYQVLLQEHIRLWLNKKTIEELYTVLNKISDKLVDLSVIKKEIINNVSSSIN